MQNFAITKEQKPQGRYAEVKSKGAGPSAALRYKAKVEIFTIKGNIDTLTSNQNALIHRDIDQLAMG